MNIRCWIGVGLMAALGAGSAAGYDGARFRGTVMDGAPDYSDAAFAPLEEVAAKLATGDQNDPELMDSFGKALMGIMCPHGPMAGLRVTLRSAGETPEARETATDEKGQFRFDSLAIGEYALAIHQSGKGCQGPQEYSWRLKIDDEYRQTGAELAWPAQLLVARGMIVDSAGQPLAGVRITAYENRYNGELDRWSGVLHVVETATDKRGGFELAGLRPMRFFPGDGGPAGYVLKVEKEGFAPCVRRIDALTKETQDAMRRWWSIMVKAVPSSRGRATDIQWPVPANPRGAIENVDFTLIRAATLGGCVRDGAGTPITNASVSFRHLDAPPYLPLPFPFEPKTTRTDAAGRFSIPGLATGRYHVVVAVDYRGREYPDVPVELREGEVRDDLDLRYEVPPTGRIEASVFDKDSAKPIGVYTAYVERVLGTPDSGITSGSIAKDTNRPGFFVVENVSPGETQFRISAPGYVSRQAACAVESGKTALLPIEMQPAGAAQVRVTCNGVATRPHQLVSFPEGATNAVWGSWRTNADGRCEIHELPPGLNRLRALVSGNDQSRYVLVAVQIEAGKTNSVELETEGPCSFDLDLAFPTNAVMRAWVEPADAPETDTFYAKVDMKVHLWAYESGRVAVTNLPAGDYRIGVQKLESIQSRDRVPMKADQTKTIRLEDGQRPAVAFEF